LRSVTREREFLQLPELNLEQLQTAWQEAVFALYLAEDKIEPEVVESMRTWPHGGLEDPAALRLVVSRSATDAAVRGPPRP
jgi:hypothetical protein